MIVINTIADIFLTYIPPGSTAGLYWLAVRIFIITEIRVKFCFPSSDSFHGSDGETVVLFILTILYVEELEVAHTSPVSPHPVGGAEVIGGPGDYDVEKIRIIYQAFCCPSSCRLSSYEPGTVEIFVLIFWFSFSRRSQVGYQI